MKTTATAAIVALLSFVVGNIWVFVSADMFVRYFYEARMVALTHVFTLGWVSLMIIGVLRQLAPLSFGLKLSRPGMLGATVALWVPGLIAMVVGFATYRYELAAAGTVLVFSGAIVAGGVLLSGFRGLRRELPHNHLLAALLYFMAAALVGAWMGVSKGFDVPLAAPFHRMLFAHIHLAGAGWAGMMILAVMSRLFPQPHLRSPRQAQARFAAFNIGLVGLSAGLLTGGGWYPVFGSILAAAAIWYALAFVPVLREFGQPSDRSTAFLITSWICFAVVAVIGLLFTVIPPEAAILTRLQFVYGFIYMFGWLSFMILGMLYRIIPTHISKFMAARGLPPAMGLRGALVDPDLQIIVFACLVPGLIVSSLGILFEAVMLFRFGWAMWLAGIIGFGFGIARLGIALRRLLGARSA